MGSCLALPPRSSLFPDSTLFRSSESRRGRLAPWVIALPLPLLPTPTTPTHGFLPGPLITTVTSQWLRRGTCVSVPQGSIDSLGQTPAPSPPPHTHDPYAWVLAWPSHRDLHSSPTRRSSDLQSPGGVDWLPGS